MTETTNVDIGLNGWEEVKKNTGEMVDWEQTKVVMGKLTDIRENVGENNSTIYTVEKEGGEAVSFWSTTVLKGHMDSCALNDEVRVEYLGNKKGKSGRIYKDFKVMKKHVE
ncbi:MAG: hypothetical protein Q8R36_03785 [bacterium]|nr:hypothetical protein [bacterium]